MKTKALSGLLPMILVLGACAGSPPKPDTTPSGATEMQGPPGIFASESYSATASVSAIDRNTRQVTLLGKDGNTVTFIAGPEVRNFDQINVGDHVTATLDTEIDLSVRKSGPPVPEGVVTVDGRAARGDKPGVASVTTAQGVAKIVGLDTARREATLAFSDGRTRTYPVRPGLDLTKVSVGDEVVFRATQANSILVTRP